MKEIKAPNDFTFAKLNKVLFAGGSINMGKSDDWQSKLVKSLEGTDFTILNPRRTDWDSSWEQNKENEQFYEQVDWELSAMELADIIIMNFESEGESPISLLELGLHAKSGKLVVLCQDGYFRKGNVDIVCERYGVKQVETFEDLIEYLKNQ